MSEAQALGVLVGELLRKQITPKLGPGIKVQVACQGSEALGQPASEIWDGEKRETGGVQLPPCLVIKLPSCYLPVYGAGSPSL